MANLNDFTMLKTKAEKLQREASRAEGALEADMKRLKSEFGCSSLKEADAKLIEMREEEDRAKAAFDELFAKFEKDWADDLV